MAATFKSINSLLKDIIIKVSLRIEEEKKIMDRIRKIKAENDNFRSSILQEQQLQDPVMQQLQQYEPQPQLPSLQAIQSICSNVISRINILREYVTQITDINLQLYIRIRNVSIRVYIEKNKGDIKACYDNINNEIEKKLSKQYKLSLQDKQPRQDTIFKKGYLLYDLIRTKNEDEFRRMLTDERTTYNEIRHEPQIGGAKSTLLQVIGLTKIIAILSYLFITHNNQFNIFTGTQTLTLNQYIPYIGKDYQGVNIFYLLNDEKEPLYESELTKEDCLLIYKNGEIINAIVSFFYTELIIPKPQPP
jgi:hypothetical protein